VVANQLLSAHDEHTEITMTLQQMIEQMKEGGLSQAAIARLAGTSQQMIHLVANGRTPRYDIGKGIEQAYKRAMRTKRKPTKEQAK
jgi:transcriptional regulator with XRE-family HTH domain